MRTTIVIGVLLAWAAGGEAAVLCKRKSGAVSYRADACKKKETAVDLNALGITGPPGEPGATGLPGGFVASALIAADSTTPVRATNVVGVTHPGVGIYCLTLADGIDATRPALVTPDAGHSTSESLVAWVQNPPDTCPDGTVEVGTYDLSGAASNAVGFVVGIP